MSRERRIKQTGMDLSSRLINVVKKLHHTKEYQEIKKALLEKIKVSAVKFTEDRIIIYLVDGRSLSDLLRKHPELEAASTEAQERWELCNEDKTLCWKELNHKIYLTELSTGIDI